MDPTFAFLGLLAVLGLGFYITVIALHHKDKDVSSRAIKTLSKLRPAGPAAGPPVRPELPKK